ETGLEDGAGFREIGGGDFLPRRRGLILSSLRALAPPNLRFARRNDEAIQINTWIATLRSQ
ncbi:hypothetical protein DCD76_19095, partial [Acinetobacter baumannii]